jgi:crotonobetainyl-CoA:carnitine CoA-transferase CaiB-like acyl-CoA transferase
MRPLEGTFVLDFTHGVAGPYGTMLLADLGADVVKVEMPKRGDATRYMNVSKKFQGDIPTSGGDYFLSINRNKRAITIDLGTEAGSSLARSLAAKADVVVQSFRPGVMKRLGLGEDDIRAVNPEVIYGSVSGYGLKGPLADQPGMDVAIQARSGVMAITGYPGSAPVKCGVSLADFATGVHLSNAVLGAVVHKLRTGKGQAVDVSLLDATMSMLANYAVAVIDGEEEIAPMGSGHPQLAPFQAFPSSDGYIVLGTGTNKLWLHFCKVIDAEQLPQDPRFKSNPERVRNREALIPLISEKMRTKTTAEWLAILEREGIPCAPVNSLRQAFAEPQLRYNEMVVEVPHPVYKSIHLVGVPYKYSATPCGIDRAPPLLGQHTDEVLREKLGMPGDTLESLRADGIV